MTQVLTPPYTDTELQLVTWLPTPLSFARIGYHMSLPEKTVRATAIGLYRKLGVVNRREAVEQTRSGVVFMTAWSKDLQAS